MIEFEISEPEFNLLKKMEKVGYAEYSESTCFLLPELVKGGLVNLEWIGWTATYKISELGKKLVRQNSK